MLRECNFLVFIVGESGLRVNDEKVNAIRNFPAPSTAKQVRRLLSMAGWYRRFVPNFPEKRMKVYVE